ncbi:MAG: hypothetical protein JNK21_00230 [Rhodospirillaceae bacterium]|nr:hypothetical protein [Rhodospirillaceae bacterium]
MDVVHASRFVFLGFSLVTVAVMVWALGPFGDHADSGNMLVSLMIAPLLAVWAVGPYAVAHKFAAEDAGAGAWVFVAVQIVAGLAVMVLYGDAFVMTPEPDLNAPLVFAILPIYQFTAVLVAYYGLRLWRRFRSS